MKDTLETVREHARLIWALMLRELATRYGRNNIGFLWVVCEPMLFCVGVLLLYRTIRGPYEHGFGILAFVATGYLPTILVRHITMYSLNAVKINNSLLYHKQLTVLDLFASRIVVEFVGVTLAAFFLFAILLTLGLIQFPVDLWVVYEGWFITALVGTGLALIVGAVSEIFEVVERIIGVTLYILVPLSGTFFLSDWLPSDVRKYVLLLPFLHCADMIRYGFFGPSVNPHYDAAYAATCGAVMVVIGLVLVRQVRQRIEVY